MIAATTAAIAVAQKATAAAVAQQKDDHNDPANVAAAETVIVTHIQIPPNFVAVNHRSFQDIPIAQKGSKNYFQSPWGYIPLLVISCRAATTTGLSAA